MQRFLLLMTFLTIALSPSVLAQNGAKSTVTGKVKASATPGGASTGKAKGSTGKPKTIKVKHGSGKPATTVAPKPLSYKPEAPPVIMRRTPTPLRATSKGTPHKP